MQRKVKLRIFKQLGGDLAQGPMGEERIDRCLETEVNLEDSKAKADHSLEIGKEEETKIQGEDQEPDQQVRKNKEDLEAILESEVCLLQIRKENLLADLYQGQGLYIFNLIL